MENVFLWLYDQLFYNRDGETFLGGSVKKTLLTCIALIVGSATAASAIPILYIVASIIFHMSVGATVWYTANRNGNYSNTSGQTVTSVNLSSIDFYTSVPTQHNSTGSAKVSNGDLKGVGNNSAHPNLQGAFNVPGYITPTNASGAGQLANGVIIQDPNTHAFYRIVSFISFSSAPGNCALATDNGVSVTYMRYTQWVAGGGTNCGGSGSSMIGVNSYYVAAASQPPSTPATDTQIAASINASPSTYTGEIDDCIKSNPNIVHFYDDAGNPIILPTAPTAAQIANAGNSGNAPPGPGTPGGTGGTPGGSGTGNAPGTPGTTTPGSGNGAGGGLPDTDSSYPVPGLQKYGDNRSNDINGRLTTFMADMQNSPLASFGSRAIGNIPSTGASTFSFNGGRFGNHTYDYAQLAPVFQVLSKLFMILTIFTCVKIITKANAV